MNIVRKFLGPRSKYEKSLPYTYEARVTMAEGSDVTNSFLSDTICGLVEYLRAEGIESHSVEILEVRHDGERLIEGALYTTGSGEWLARPDLCRSFREHYPGHIRADTCSFSDRDREVVGTT
jgi:hypothetical protein